MSLNYPLLEDVYFGHEPEVKDIFGWKISLSSMYDQSKDYGDLDPIEILKSKLERVIRINGRHFAFYLVDKPDNFLDSTVYLATLWTNPSDDDIDSVIIHDDMELLDNYIGDSSQEVPMFFVGKMTISSLISDRYILVEKKGKMYMSRTISVKE